MVDRRIERISGPLDARVRATPSKSVTHRALVAAALADGESVVCEPLDADDTRASRAGLEALGIAVSDVAEGWAVRGCGGRPRGGATLELGESGTSLRLLTAVAALGRAASRLDGGARLRERPVSELITALDRLGATVEADPATGGLPLIAGGSAIEGGSARVPGARSSQFASALLLIGPRLAAGLELTIDPPVVSLPYVELTADVLASFGASIERLDERRWKVAPGGLTGRRFTVEGDHSSASYFLAAAAVAGGRVRVDGLRPDSAQPDARLGSILRDLGCDVRSGRDWIEIRGAGSIPPFDLDLTEAPDLAPTIVVLALFATGPCVVRGIAHLRHKESDRLEVLARNLRALGRHATVVDERLVVGAPPPCLGGTRISTDGDHRIAMAFAVAGLAVEGVVIDDAASVRKSNPRFWTQLSELVG